MASLTPKTMAVTVRLDRQESDQLDRLASREREARSIVIRRLLRQGLLREEQRVLSEAGRE